MKTPKYERELEAMVREELKKRFWTMPPMLTIAVVRNGASWRAICNATPEKKWPGAKDGKLIALVTQIGDELAQQYELIR
jgi:hypothetical protein